MKLLKLKFKIIIGVVLFILLIGAYYSATMFGGGNGGVQYGEKVYKGTFIMPVENFTTVTSKFGRRQAHGVVGANHTGIDLCGTIGSKVMSVKYGEVTWAGWQDGGYGNCVEIKHINESGEIFYTFYAHMRHNSICVVKGQIVEEGQIIGVQGSTGNSTGDHLHFEIRLANRTKVDPAPYLFTKNKEGV